MKKIILVLAIFIMLQTTVAQKKKKVTTKATTTTVVAKPKATTNTTTTATKQSTSKKTSSSRSSSSEFFNKGDFQLNAGIGASVWGIPVYAAADYGVADDISVGAEVSYRSYSESYFLGDYNFTIIGIGANGNYHFGRILKIPNEWDVYGGLGLNYYIWSFGGDTNYLGNNSSGISLGGQVGARYFFNKHFGINAELGGASATSAAKVGITYKL